MGERLLVGSDCKTFPEYGATMIRSKKDLEGGWVWDESPTLLSFTSGTEGRPSPVEVFTDVKSPVDISRQRHYFDSLGLKEGETALISQNMNLFGFIQVVEELSSLGVHCVCVEHNPYNVAEVAKLIKEYKPDRIMFLSNPMILALDNYVEDESIFESVKSCIFGGEHISSHSKQCLERWGIEPFILTLVADFVLAAECSEHDGMHIHEDLCRVEILDEDDNPTTEGRLVVTNMINRNSKIHRYDTGDIARVDRDVCPCGNMHARIHILGRKNWRISIQSEIIFPKDVLEAVDKVPETSHGIFQIYRPTTKKPNKLDIRVGYDGGGRSEEVIAEEINRNFNIPIHLDVEFVPVQELLKLGPPHKIPRVI
jgi:phenylacetate-CoA ligase